MSFFDKLSDALGLDGGERGLMAEYGKRFGGMAELQDALFEDGYPEDKLKERVAGFAKDNGAHEYTLSFYLLYISAERLHKAYKERGVDEGIFWDTVMDLKYKLDECKALHGVSGTFVFDWFPGFYRMTRFALGRLQYDVTVYPREDYVKGGVTVKKGAAAYSCHIPSSGPLDKESRIDSYKRAFKFFGKSKSDPLAVICDSWLLYPAQREFLPPCRILEFMDDFDIISHEDKKGFPDAWRVFGKEHTLPLEKWPAKTSLQRGYAARLKSGKPVGTGFGILVFDGENIL